MRGVVLDPLSGRPLDSTDPISRRAQTDPRFAAVIDNLRRSREYRESEFGGEPMAADSASWRDLNKPWINAAQTAITLAATDKLMYPGYLGARKGGYWSAQKKTKITVIGTLTTAATPGNLGIEAYYGTTDAGGTLLVSSAAIALAATQTNLTLIVEMWFQCGTDGGSGTIKAMGRLTGNSALFSTAANEVMMIPASAPAFVTVDTTADSGYNLQIKRSGSTAESFTAHEVLYEALN